MVLFLIIILENSNDKNLELTRGNITFNDVSWGIYFDFHRIGDLNTLFIPTIHETSFKLITIKKTVIRYRIIIIIMKNIIVVYLCYFAVIGGAIGEVQTIMLQTY